MERSTNALAELAERMKNGIYNNPNDTRFDKPVVCASLDANDVLNAQRIVAELAKLQDEEAALFSMENITADEARRIVRQREGNCILKCRAIAEEGAGDGK